MTAVNTGLAAEARVLVERDAMVEREHLSAK